MYPLDMKLIDGIGFAVANDEAEHQALTERGYGPAWEPKEDAAASAKTTKTAAK